MITTGSTPPDSTRQPLTEEQVNALITFSNEHSNLDLGDVVKVILNTGLRRSEACDLLWDHVDLNNLKITVPGGKCSSARFIPIMPEVLTVLQNLQGYPTSKYVFGERRKCLFRRVNHQLATMAPKIGVRHLGLHTLRRTFAARLANSGAPAYLIMTIGGWRTWGSLALFFSVSEPVLKSAYESAMKKAS